MHLVAETTGIAPGVVSAVLECITDITRAAVLSGVPVTLPRLLTLEPYMRRRTKAYSCSTGKVQDIPSRHYVRARLAPALKAALKAETACA